LNVALQFESDFFSLFISLTPMVLQQMRNRNPAVWQLCCMEITHPASGGDNLCCSDRSKGKRLEQQGT
jgi:hypothetical protein